jgi:hypothetical protein
LDHLGALTGLEGKEAIGRLAKEYLETHAYDTNSRARKRCPGISVTTLNTCNP